MVEELRSDTKFGKKSRKQGKSEGFDSCNGPSNLTQIGIQIID